MLPTTNKNSKFDRRTAIAGLKAAVIAINYMLHQKNPYSQRQCSTLQDARTNALNLLDQLMVDEEERPTVGAAQTPTQSDDEGIPY